MSLKSFGIQHILARQARAWDERDRSSARERERLLGVAGAEARALHAAAAEACAGVDEGIAALAQASTSARSSIGATACLAMQTCCCLCPCKRTWTLHESA